MSYIDRKIELTPWMTGYKIFIETKLKHAVEDMTTSLEHSKRKNKDNEAFKEKMDKALTILTKRLEEIAANIQQVTQLVSEAGIYELQRLRMDNSRKHAILTEVEHNYKVFLTGTAEFTSIIGEIEKLIDLADSKRYEQHKAIEHAVKLIEKLTDRLVDAHDGYWEHFIRGGGFTVAPPPGGGPPPRGGPPPGWPTVP